MTIDEHFLYMIILEGLIFFIGIGSMYYQQKRTADMIEEVKKDPDVLVAAVFGIMEKIKDDPEKQEVFFGFVQACGVNAFSAIREYVQGSGIAGAPEVKLPKRHGLKPFEGILNQFLPNLVEGFINGAQKKATAKAAEAGTEALSGW